MVTQMAKLITRVFDFCFFWWKKMIQIGSHPNMTVDDRRNLKIVNQISWLVAGVLVASLCLFLTLIQDPVMIAVVFSIFVISLPALFFNYFLKYHIAKVAFLLAQGIIYLGLSVAVADGGNAHIGLLFVGITAMVIFDKNAYKYGFLIFGLILFCVAEAWFEYHGPLLQVKSTLVNKFISGTAVGMMMAQLIAFYRSEVQRTETKLEEQKAHFKAIIDGNLDACVTINQKGQIIGWNPQAESIFGFTQKEVKGQLLHQLIIPRQYQNAHNFGMEYHLATGEHSILNKRIEIEGRHKNGKTIPIELSVTPIKAEGKPKFSAFIRDITELKKNREELLSVNKELNSFVAVASHDLKAPLRTITSFSSLLEETTPKDEESRIFLNFIKKAGTQMENLIDDLVEYSMAGKTTQTPKNIDLNEIVQITKNNLHQNIQEKKAVVAATFLPHITAHKTPILQLFQNLVGNAIKYQKKGKQPIIKIEADRLENHWQIAIHDNGIGMDEHYAETIFEPFKRLHTHSEYEGSGIGLATCKKIVERYDGKIWAISEKGKGSTFYFTLKDG